MVAVLENPEQAEELLQKMDAALAVLPLDFEAYGTNYQQKTELLSELHQYAEGTYTIFPTLEQRLAHSGHPVLLWMMDNIYIRTDPAGNVKADKEKSTEKIDGAVATIIGLDRAIRCGNNTGASVYDDRGILFL